VLPEQRIQQIEERYAYAVQDILVLQITDETLKVLFVLLDGSTLRIAERWRRSTDPLQLLLARSGEPVAHWMG